MKERMQEWWSTIPNWMKNKYFITVVIFIIVVLFLDGNNIFRLVDRKQTLHRLNKQEQQYKQELIQLKEQKEAFESDDEALEKFAREEYRMKKDDEDVFVIVEKETEE